MRRTAPLPLWLLLALLTATPLAAQSSTDIITGTVSAPTGEPLSGATVTAVSAESGVRRSTLTNAQGRFTIVFPEGAGRYQLEVTHLGMAPYVRPVVRVADEDVLVVQVRMDILPIAIEGLEVTARREPSPWQREPGSQENVMRGEALNRLPVDPTDLAAIAALTPGVIGLEGGDSIGMSFSVLGQGPAANQITLDGMSFGGAEGFGGGMMGMGVPQEAVRMTRVVTNTYDVSRGQFSGGMIATTTRSGTNQAQGNFTWALRDPALQWTVDDSPFAGASRQNRFSGGFGGPIIRDRLFYFGSVMAQRRSEGVQSLISADPVSLQRLGAHPDSVGRFFGALTGAGINPLHVPAPEDRLSDALTALGRIDFNLNSAHTLTLRGDARLMQQDGFRIGALGLPQSGGRMESTGGGAMLSLTSRFGNGWINELRTYASGDRRRMLPYLEIPEGRVRVTSELENGTYGISTLTFGGSSMGMNSRDRSFEISNELSLLLGTAHRVRLGALLNSTRSTQELGTNQFGSFTFNSLADVEAGRPASFTRSLTARDRESGGLNAALYLGDTWRATPRLQLTYGARLEGSDVGTQPEHNPEIERLFGRRTDAIPSEVRLSPRVGFSFNVGGEPNRPTGVLRGGFGEFRARPPWSTFANARDATGLPESQVQIYCVGAAVPTPDWGAYLQQGPASIPAGCEGESPLLPVSGRGSSVTVFDPGFGASRSWRASLGFQRRLLQFMSLSLDATYARGVAQQGIRDLNLRTDAAFPLAAEGGRPVFAPAAAIVPGTGEVGFLASRLHPQFGQVLEMHADLESRTTQLTVGLNGFVQPLRIFFQSSYTHSRSRDQGSGGGWGFGRFGGGGFGGFGGGGLPSTAGNPNQPEWARSDFDRPHAFTATIGRQVRPWFDLSLVGRASVGSPFTPIVGGDINGDGARNDRAFLFDPASAQDPALAAAMTRLLAGAPERVRSCLESQLGEVAERNSCRGPWTHALDLRANLRPELPGIGRRLTISVDAVNSLNGLDQLLHGSSGLRGWGQPNRPDPVLLYPRGFDPATQSFRYEVNERFGNARQGALAFRNPFQLQIQGRVAVGRAPQGPGGMMGGFGSGRGGRGGGMVPMPGGEPGAGGGQQGMMQRAFMNPVSAILGLADTLQLTPQQVQELRLVADTLQGRQDSIAAAVREQMAAARQQGDPGSAFRALQPRIAEGRRNVEEALAEAQRILTPEQWERVPEELKQQPAGPGERGGPGGGRRGPR